MGLVPRLFNPDRFEPIAEPGDNVLLQQPSGYDLYHVEYVEPLPRSAPISLNLLSQGTTLAAATAQTSRISLDGQVDMPPGSLAQLRAFVIDNINVTLYQPQSTARGVSLNAISVITPFQRFSDPNFGQTEFFVFQQQRPYVSATNRWALQSISLARLMLFGFRLLLGGTGGIVGPTGLKAFPPDRHFKTLEEAEKALGNRMTVVPIAAWGL